jgi:hypothetical protein
LCGLQCHPYILKANPARLSFRRLCSSSFKRWWVSL